MRRAFTILAVLLVAAITTVLVAWTCALRSVAPEGGSGPLSLRLTSHLPTRWANLPRSQFGDPQYVTCGSDGVWRGFGATVVGCSVIGREGTPDLPSCSVFPVGSIRYEKCGWPWRSLECFVADGCSGPERYITGGLEAPQFLHRKSIASIRGFSFSAAYHPALPTTPLWKPLIYNWLFYAALLTAIIVAPRELRQRWRARRGHCPACAYDLRGTPTESKCPECGVTPPNNRREPATIDTSVARP
jgi:hypothetical protein